jgi:type II secretory pathway pseudopilin PulG
MSRLLLIAAFVLVLHGGCKRKPKDTAPDTPPPPAPSNSSPAPSGNAGSGGVVPGGGLGIVVNPQAALGGGGGGGAAQAVRKAARRTQALNEMHNLGLAIEAMRTESGRMPTKDQIVAELKDSPKVLEAVKEGSIILTGTTDGGGLWAYEVGADTEPGIALIGGKATRTTPDELRQYFQGK